MTGSAVVSYLNSAVLQPLGRALRSGASAPDALEGGGGGGVRRRQTVLCVGPDAGGPSPASHSVHAYDAVLASHSPLCLLLCCRTDAVQHSDAEGHPVLYLTSLEAHQHCISKSRLGPW